MHGPRMTILPAFLAASLLAAPAAARMVFSFEEPAPTVTATFTEIPEQIFTPDPVIQDNYVRLAGDILREIAAIRGLPVKRDVPIRFKDKGFFRDYFNRKMREDTPPEKLQPILKAYQAMGLYNPAGVKDPYEEEIKDLLVGIRGLYDPEKKEVYIAEWTDPEDWDDLVAHELAHALQDQYHDLKGWMDSLKDLSFDQQYAKSCVVEGEATALALERRLKVSEEGKTLAQSEAVRRQNDINMLIEVGRAWFKGQRGRIRIKNYMGFAYAYGATFFQEVLKQKDWTFLDTVYRNPPRTTAEVIHPEYYLGKRPRRVTIRIEGLTEEGAPLAGYRKVWEDRLGEYGLTMLLESRIHYQYARSAVVGWKGDLLQVYEDPGNKSLALLGYVRFGTKEQAGRFFDSYREFLGKKVRPDGALFQDDAQFRIENPRTGKLCHLEARGERVVFAENIGKESLDALMKEVFPKRSASGKDGG